MKMFWCANFKIRFNIPSLFLVLIILANLPFFVHVLRAWREARIIFVVDKKSSSSVASFYKFLWNHSIYLEDLFPLKFLLKFYPFVIPNKLAICFHFFCLALYLGVNTFESSNYTILNAVNRRLVLNRHNISCHRNFSLNWSIWSFHKRSHKHIQYFLRFIF